MAKLKAGEYAAFISGDSQLVPRAYADDSCSLHILDEHVANFDTAVAFRRGFPSDAFREAVSGVLLEMQQNETLAVRPPDPPARHVPRGRTGLLQARVCNHAHAMTT